MEVAAATATTILLLLLLLFCADNGPRVVAVSNHSPKANLIEPMFPSEESNDSVEPISESRRHAMSVERYIDINVALYYIAVAAVTWCS
jgi:hypothetical protein